MFDFSVRQTSNTVARLDSGCGFDYCVRFYCGKYRAFMVGQLTDEQANEIKKLLSEVVEVGSRTGKRPE